VKKTAIPYRILYPTQKAFALHPGTPLAWRIHNVAGFGSRGKCYENIDPSPCAVASYGDTAFAARESRRGPRIALCDVSGHPALLVWLIALENSDMYRRGIITFITITGLTLAAGCASKNANAAGQSPCQAKSGAPCQTAGDKPCSKPCPKNSSAKRASFGDPMKLADGETVCIKKVLADPKAYDGKYVRIAGLVDSVCAKRGCWMRIGDGEGKETLFVKFTCPVKGRLIPMKAVGHVAQVEGKLEITEVPEDYARHLKEDAGASKEEIEKIVGPQKMLKLSSKAAQISGI